MREAIGGGWLLGFVVLFIVLFSSFLAVSINYTKAFKVKNQILNIIEQNGGYSDSQRDLNTLSDTEIASDLSTEAKIYKVLKDTGYFNSSIVNCPKKYTSKNGGYCVRHICNGSSNLESGYYKVITYIRFEIPVVNLDLKIPINGETKTIYYDIGEC